MSQRDSATTKNRNLRVASSPASPFQPTGGNFLWVQAEGAGTVTVTDESNNTTAFPLYNREALMGPFSALVSFSGCDAVRIGDGKVPSPVPSSALLASTNAGNGASTVGIADAGNFTAQTTVEGALQEIYQDAESAKAIIELPASSFYLLTGAPLAIFSDGASAVPGSVIVGSKAFGIQWNENATQNGIMRSFQTPPDMDITANAILHIRAAKIGATLADATTFDVALYNQVDGVAYDADTNFGGTSSAMQGDLTTKLAQNVTLTIALADLAAFPASTTITIKPTDGTLATDDIVLLGAYILYKRKLRTS